MKEFFDTENSQTSSNPRSVMMFKMEAIAEDGTTVMGEIPKRYFKLDEEELTNKFLNFDVCPEPKQATLQLSMLPQFDLGVFSTQFGKLFDQSAYYGRVPAFEEGKQYTIKITLSRWTIDPSTGYPRYGEDKECSGTFQLQYKVAAISSLQTEQVEADKLVKDSSRKSAMEERGLPKEWDLKGAKIGSGETEKQLEKIFLSQEPPNTKVVKLVALPAEGGWVMYRDEKVSYEKILFRWFNQTLIFFSEREGTYTCSKGGVRQDYLGNSTYGDSYLKWEERSPVGASFIEAALNKNSKKKK
ncbi:MAG: hypothetical protein JSS79_08620 [Bacteroidetes bacterium]|nr:hypothetical protein [Bacteroidota bacterium]